MEDRYLFKAKRADNGEWVIGNLITNVFFRLGQSIPYILCPDKAEYDCFEDFTEENGIFEVRPDTICQCTGLRDKNGKLIWEGDIILFQRDNDDCPFPDKDTKKRLGKVFYKDFRTTFAIEMGKSRSGSLNDDLWKYVQNGNRVEVIGNIFDNPELIKER